MVTYLVKGCSNQSRLNKNVCYHKVLEGERKLNSYIKGKPQLCTKFYAKSDKEAFLHRKFRHYTSSMEQNEFIQWNKKIF